MTITPQITEVHERRYRFALSAEQVQDTIIAACLKAAGLSGLPDGIEFTMQVGSGLQPIDLRFTVPVETGPVISGDGSGTALPPLDGLRADPIISGDKAYGTFRTRPKGWATPESPSTPAAPQPAASEPIPAPEASDKLKAAPAAPTAPRKAIAKPARPEKWLDLSSPVRSIVLHLEALPDTFSPTDDLNIAQCLTGGVKATEIAPEMGVTPEEVVARWKAMWCSAVLEKSRTPTIAGQERLIAALKYRVETEE